MFDEFTQRQAMGDQSISSDNEEEEEEKEVVVEEEFTVVDLENPTAGPSGVQQTKNSPQAVLLESEDEISFKNSFHQNGYDDTIESAKRKSSCSPKLLHLKKFKS